MTRPLTAIVALVLSLLVVGCDDAVESGGSGAGPYPVERSITNAEGKSIVVTIIGSTGAELIFTREGESKHYRYPFHKLSAGDRQFAEGLPVRVPQAPYQPKDTLEDARVQGIANSIERLIVKAEDLHKEYQQPEMLDNRTRQRALEREIQKVEVEIDNLREEYFTITGNDHRSNYQYRFIRNRIR